MILVDFAMPPMVFKNKIYISSQILDDTGRNQSRWVVMSSSNIETNDKPTRIHYMIAFSAPNRARQSESARERTYFQKLL